MKNIQYFLGAHLSRPRTLKYLTANILDHKNRYILPLMLETSRTEIFKLVFRPVAVKIKRLTSKTKLFFITLNIRPDQTRNDFQTFGSRV